ncbi:MAG: pirin family protein [Finegoldia magna]|nr:pirin family protein [Finegoldia magna]
MKKFRTIENIFKGPEPHMVGDGFRVSQYIPTGIKSMERLSPFLLLDYNAPYYFKPSETRLGVGAHPHRGFETVTIAYDGKVEHHDNKGNHGIIGPGDVQWMTAASGIMHKEYHETEFSKNGGIFHMVQLWVNLPKDKKMIDDLECDIINDLGVNFLMDNFYPTINKNDPKLVELADKYKVNIYNDKNLVSKLKENMGIYCDLKIKSKIKSVTSISAILGNFTPSLQTISHTVVIAIIIKNKYVTILSYVNFIMPIPPRIIIYHNFFCIMV